MTAGSEILRFGLFELDLTQAVLIKEGRRIKLQEQPFRLLCILLEHPGETVTRERIKQALWTADTFVDFDRSLNAAMAKNLGPDVSRTSLMESSSSLGNRRKSFLARRFCIRSIHSFCISGGSCDITASAHNRWETFRQTRTSPGCVSTAERP